MYEVAGVDAADLLEAEDAADSDRDDDVEEGAAGGGWAGETIVSWSPAAGAPLPAACWRERVDDEARTSCSIDRRA